MVRTDEFGCELVESMGIVASTGKQNQGATGTAPVDHFEFDVADDPDLGGPQLQRSLPIPRDVLSAQNAPQQHRHCNCTLPHGSPLIWLSARLTEGLDAQSALGRAQISTVLTLISGALSYCF